MLNLMSFVLSLSDNNIKEISRLGIALVNQGFILSKFLCKGGMLIGKIPSNSLNLLY